MSLALPSRKLLHQLSRDRSFLLRAAVVIGMAGLVVAALIDQLREKRGDGVARARMVEPIDRLEELGWSLAGLGEKERATAAARNAVGRIVELIGQWEVGEKRTRIYADFIRLCGQLPDDRAGLEEMELWGVMLGHCGQPDAGGHAPRLAAELAVMVGWRDEAIRILEDGYGRTGEVLLLERAAEQAFLAGDREYLVALLGDAERLSRLDAGVRCDLAVWLRDYGELLRSVVVMDLQGLRPGLFLLSLLAVSVWFSVLMQFAATWHRWLLMVTALCLGMLSAVLTLYLVFIQEDIRGFVPRGELGHDLFYWVAGVGLREEMLKALCFVPLLPWLVRQRAALLALVAAAVVGLGFALQENAIYFLEDGSSVTWGRFLTSTFLHTSLSGIVGYALYLLARDPRRNWENALIDLISAVVAHGMYDAFLGVEQLADYSILSLVFISYLAYRFFGLVETLRAPARITVSPLGIFVLGCAMVLAVTLNFSLWDMPLREGVFIFGLEVIGIAPVAFLFVRQFRDL